MTTKTLLFFASFLFFNIANAQNLQVMRVLPTGENVTQTDSVNITFNKPMVALGEFEKTAQIPVTITPKLECEWRWINTTTLSCKLAENQQLKFATEYRVVVKKEIKDLKGVSLAQDFMSTFATARPAVTYHDFSRWLSPGFPIVNLSFNSFVTAESVMKSIEFTENGVAVPTRVLSLEAAEKIYLNSDKVNEVMKAVKEEAKAGTVSQRWTVVPRSDFKDGANVSVHVKPGLQGKEGPLLGAENRDVVTFVTYPAFKFAGFNCPDDEGSANPNMAPLTGSTCNPLKNLYVKFSVPVNLDSFKKNCTFSPLKKGEGEEEFWANVYSYASYNAAPVANGVFSVQLPAVAKARTDFTLACNENVEDMFGRKLGAKFQIGFKTDPRSPKLMLGYEFGVLEKGIDSEIPVFVTNLTDVYAQYSAKTAALVKKNQKIPVALQKVDDLAYATPLGVRKMLDGQSGVVYSVLTSSTLPTGYEESRNRGFFQVTPFYVHYKEGHYNSLIWVKDLATGKPIEGADITLFSSTFAMIADLHSEKVLGKTGKEGLANLPGTISYDPDLTGRRYGFNDPKLMIQVKKGNDIAIVPLAYEFQSYAQWNSREGEYSYSSPQTKYGHIKIWGTSPQGVYRAGDTIDFKIYVREQNVQRFVPAPKGTYSLVVTDPTGNQVFKQDKILLNDFGGFNGSFKTAKNAPVGWYRFHVNSNYLEKRNGAESGDSEDGEGGGRVAGIVSHKVLVTDFTPAPFRPENDIDRDIYRFGEKITLNSRGRLHSGGPFADAKARINVSLVRGDFEPQKNPLAERYGFQCSGGYYGQRETVFEKEEQLNHQGDLKNEIPLSEKNIQCGRLIVTSDISDDRGKFYSAVKSAKYYAVDRFVGLRQDKFFYQANQEADFNYIVVDTKSQVLKGIPVDIEIQRLEVKKVRMKGSGNAYLEETKSEWVKAGSCTKATSEKDSTCSFRPTMAGSYKIIAKVKDGQGRENVNTQSMYVAGKDIVVWDTDENSSLSIIAEKSNPKVGETAKYLVQNPFPGAEALISIERYGVLKSWTQKFDTSTPVVEVPITEDMLPGAHLSVTVFSPRVVKPLGENQVDLGKPTFKMGYIKIVPDNPVKKIDVKVVTDAPEYKPGSKVTVNLAASTKSPRPLEKVEFAVAVLDEAVFDLINGGSDYFDIYKGFYQLDPLDVTNFDILMQLVGRRKFEKKGANAGGDGGGLSMRSVFKYVAYWNPSLKADNKGQVKFDFKIPDNLTGWRVLVIATTASDRMGLGQGTFKANRPTEVRPVMPNIVREGDTFKGAFSVMNRTDKPRDLKVTVSATGDVVLDPKSNALIEKTVHAEPYKRQIVDFDVKVPLLKEIRNAADGNIQFTVVAGDALDKDGMKSDLPVLRKRSFLTEANYVSTTEAKSKEAVSFPKDIYTDVGNITVAATGTVIGNVESAFAYMRSYPYMCWEQRLTKGVAASSFFKLQDYIDPNFKWPQAPEIVKMTLEDATGFQAPNGGMCYYQAKDSYVSPYLSAYTALAFGWLKERGEKVPAAMLEKLNKYLLGMLRTDVSPSFYSAGMSSTVRAVALAALAKSKSINSQDVERYRSHIKTMDLFGKAHYLQAALQFSDREAAAKEALSAILGTANETGGKFRFSEVQDFGWTRIHSTETRTQCAILSALSQAAVKPWAQSMISDVPFKLVRTITQARKGKERWENTQENMFCSEALIDYGRRYEATKPAMKVSVSLAGKNFGSGEIKDFRQKPLEFKRDILPTDPGTKTEIQIDRTGQGRLYYTAAITYAPKEDFAKSRNAGIEARREYLVERAGKFVLLTSPMKIKKGELVRVNLYVNVPSARSFVVVNDPVPGGLEVLNEDLANTSAVDANKAKDKIDRGAYLWKFDDWNYFSESFYGFYHQEIRHDSVRFYSEYLEKGRYQLSYMAQAIAPGSFVVMPMHAEEMYDPDVFGKTTADTLEVQ
ncbi:MAG: Ig-like domain-containing protein [Bdellovibrionales bacterium]|nr:Ig-like domain-containing protein [Bdellovibrionales bacterium]